MTDTPVEMPQETPVAPKKRGLLIGIAAVAAAGVIAAAIAVPMTFSAKAEKNRIPDAAKECGLTKGSYTVLDDGDAIDFESAGLVLSGIPVGAEPEKVLCVMTELGAPDSTGSKVGNTRSLDGTREANWDGYHAEWTYHPDDGLNMIIEKVKG